MNFSSNHGPAHAWKAWLAIASVCAIAVPAGAQSAPDPVGRTFDAAVEERDRLWSRTRRAVRTPPRGPSAHCPGPRSDGTLDEPFWTSIEPTTVLVQRDPVDGGGQNGYDDHPVIGLNTFNDRRNGYIFEVNSLGTQDDAIFTDERLQDWNWDGVYRSEGRRTAEGWTMEIAIPSPRSAPRHADTLVAR